MLGRKESLADDENLGRDVTDNLVRMLVPMIESGHTGTKGAWWPRQT
jgi:hypothetical protein